MSKIIPKFKGKVEKGKLTLNNQSKFELYLNGLEGEIELIIKRAIKHRSLNQNNLYWLYLNVISEDTGNTPEELNEYFKRVHLKPQNLNCFNKTIPIPGSTTTLNTAEFTD